MMFSFVLAQSLNKQVPMGQTACAPLKEDGITKGLYGLCIAYCEAQMHASPDPLISESMFEASAVAELLDKILADYNQKKEPAEPEMPCIQVAHDTRASQIPSQDR